MANGSAGLAFTLIRSLKLSVFGEAAAAATIILSFGTQSVGQFMLKLQVESPIFWLDLHCPGSSHASPCVQLKHGSG